MIEFLKNDFNISEIYSIHSFKEGNINHIHKENGRLGNGLALYLGGERRFVFSGGTKITVKGNSVIFLPKGSKYEIREITPSEFYIINFHLYDNLDFEPFSLKIKRMEAIFDSFKNVKNIWSRKVAGYIMKSKSEFYNIIYHLQRELEIPYGGNSLSKIKPAVDYIHSHYDKENISVSYLVQLCNMSDANLRNLFIKNFGIPPVKYINDLKMTLAKDLLLSGHYTVKEVCFLSGFQDESYFNREFKKRFAITPGEYKNK